MTYITVKQPPMYHQLTLEEFLFNTNAVPTLLNSETTNTRTYAVETVSDRFIRKMGFNIVGIIEELERFNASTEELRKKPRKDLYYEFYIPKKSGGLRKIDAPQPELMDTLRRLKTIFEIRCGALYHTAAFAYVEGRSTISAIKRHQANESKWFEKNDLSNFFGSTTHEYIMFILSMIFPFSEVIKIERGRVALNTAIELCTLNGVLPQGTPISPMLTNIIMIPIDYKLANSLRDFNNQRFVYTRYADDFIISSQYDFDFKEIERHIVATLEEFHAPFKLNEAKTRYGSSSGSNWNLGVMLNKDNQITIGYRRKRQFQAMINNFILDTLHGIQWPLHDIQHLDGCRNYYEMVEGKEVIDAILKHIGDKYKVDVKAMIRDQLRVA